MDDNEANNEIPKSLIENNAPKPIVKENPVKSQIIKGFGDVAQAVIWSEIINRPVSMRKNRGRHGL